MEKDNGNNKFESNGANGTVQIGKSIIIANPFNIRKNVL